MPRKKPPEKKQRNVADYLTVLTEQFKREKKPREKINFNDSLIDVYYVFSSNLKDALASNYQGIKSKDEFKEYLSEFSCLIAKKEIIDNIHGQFRGKTKIKNVYSNHSSDNFLFNHFIKFQQIAFIHQDINFMHLLNGEQLQLEQTLLEEKSLLTLKQITKHLTLIFDGSTRKAKKVAAYDKQVAAQNANRSSLQNSNNQPSSSDEQETDLSATEETIERFEEQPTPDIQEFHEVPSNAATVKLPSFKNLLSSITNADYISGVYSRVQQFHEKTQTLLPPLPINNGIRYYHSSSQTPTFFSPQTFQGQAPTNVVIGEIVNLGEPSETMHIPKT